MYTELDVPNYMKNHLCELNIVKSLHETHEKNTSFEAHVYYV